MKFTVFTSVFLISVQLYLASSVTSIDNRIRHCIPMSVGHSEETIQEYTALQVVTDLTRKPLREIAGRNYVMSGNANYNTFLACSFVIYDYQNKQGKIIFDTIERSLREAIILEVGSTGPAIHLSIFEANEIVNQCKNVSGFTPGQTAVQVQNCLLKQIKHFETF